MFVFKSKEGIRAIQAVNSQWIVLPVSSPDGVPEPLGVYQISHIKNPLIRDSAARYLAMLGLACAHVPPLSSRRQPAIQQTREQLQQLDLVATKSARNLERGLLPAWYGTTLPLTLEIREHKSGSTQAGFHLYVYSTAQSEPRCMGKHLSQGVPSVQGQHSMRSGDASIVFTGALFDGKALCRIVTVTPAGTDKEQRPL